MTTNDSGMRDDLTVALNEPEPAKALIKPDGYSGYGDWLAYVIGLGADPRIGDGGTQHWDEATEEYITTQALGRSELMELAERLGG